MELDAIAAVVIGGTLLVGGAGTISGTLCGVLLLGVIQNVINQIGNLTSSVQSVVSGAFLVVVVVTQSYLSRSDGCDDRSRQGSTQVGVSLKDIAARAGVFAVDRVQCGQRLSAGR